MGRNSEPEANEEANPRSQALRLSLDFDLYRVKVPIGDYPGANLSVIDLSPQDVENTIFFQHGFAGVPNPGEWQLAHFANRHRVIAPDLRGHGQSDAPRSDYSMPELVQDMHGIVEALNLPDRFVLVGHSFGGAVCIEYAHAYPERLAKLILIATAGEYPVPRSRPPVSHSDALRPALLALSPPLGRRISCAEVDVSQQSLCLAGLVQAARYPDRDLGHHGRARQLLSSLCL